MIAEKPLSTHVKPVPSHGGGPVCTSPPPSARQLPIAVTYIESSFRTGRGAPPVSLPRAGAPARRAYVGGARAYRHRARGDPRA